MSWLESDKKRLKEMLDAYQSRSENSLAAFGSSAIDQEIESFEKKISGYFLNLTFIRRLNRA